VPVALNGSMRFGWNWSALGRDMRFANELLPENQTRFRTERHLGAILTGWGPKYRTGVPIAQRYHSGDLRATCSISLEKHMLFAHGAGFLTRDQRPPSIAVVPRLDIPLAAEVLGDGRRLREDPADLVLDRVG
jgi:hypothetical protein